MYRDWGWAPEYVDAMWRMLQLEQARDLVIATGTSYSLEAYVAAAFAEHALDWRDHVDQDPALFRPSEIAYNGGDASRAKALLNWQARYRMPDVVRLMVAGEGDRAEGAGGFP